jgi:hypothetical protein
MAFSLSYDVNCKAWANRKSIKTHALADLNAAVPSQIREVRENLVGFLGRQRFR